MSKELVEHLGNKTHNHKISALFGKVAHLPFSLVIKCNTKTQRHINYFSLDSSVDSCLECRLDTLLIYYKLPCSTCGRLV